MTHGIDDELIKIREKKMKEFMEKKEFPQKPLEVTDNEFEDMVGRYPVVVVDFWSEFCPPCRMIAPVLEDLAKELQGRVVFGKVCVDTERMMAAKFGISAIPTLLIFSGGKLKDTIIGYKSKEDLKERLKQYLK